MPVRISDNIARMREKVADLLDGWEAELAEVGKIAAEEIVKTTLDGIGLDDRPFAPYSARYQATIDAVGGKPGGGVNLRGVFWHRNQKGPRRFRDFKREAQRQARALKRGGGRRAYIRVSVGGRTFTAMTAETRPRFGINDPNSEMSADLIQIKTFPKSVRIWYEPRDATETYMIDAHQLGNSRTPARPWFGINKTRVKDRIKEALKDMALARVRNWNSG